MAHNPVAVVNLMEPMIVILNFVTHTGERHVQSCSGATVESIVKHKGHLLKPLMVFSKYCST